MARFSADEGRSNPRRKRQRTHNSSQHDSDIFEEEEEEEEEEGSSEEEDEESDDDEAEEEGADENTTQTAIVEAPRSSSNPVGPIRNGAICVTLTDPEVLDCPICYDSLTIPVYQCENGHTACSSCCKRLAHKCPSCSLPIGYNRCRAIEKVLESVKLPCHNLRYGCKEMVSYSKKFDHDKICNNAPCSCPQSGCNFIGSSRQLYQHFRGKHKGSASSFRYNTAIPVFFPVNHKSLVLQEEKEGVIFVLSNTAEIIGNVITVNCIGSPSSKEGYFYQLETKKEGSNLRFQSFTKNIQKVNHDDPHSDEFLVVPGSFLGSYGQISLDLCIWHYGMSPRDTQVSTIINPQNSSMNNRRSSSVNAQRNASAV